MRLEDLIGRQLGRYRVSRLLGRGGMAAVFLADDTVLRRSVALKILYPQYMADPALVERFRREAITAARLDHSRIGPIYDVGEIDGVVYIAMKLLAGRSLQDELLERDSLPTQDVVEIVSSVAAALDYAHASGVVHRDIKPGNIMLTPDGPVLSDFGIARVLDSPGLTGTGVVVGTPDYMAPEQIDSKRGPVDGRADVYALGVVAYRMLTGERPFAGSTTEVLMAHLTTAPPAASERNPRLAQALDGVLQRALAKQPQDRYASAGAFASALRDATSAATEVGIAPPPAASRQRAVPLIPAAAPPSVTANRPMDAEAIRTARLEAARRRKGANWPILLGIGVFMLLVAAIATRTVLNERAQGSVLATRQAATNIALAQPAATWTPVRATSPTLISTAAPAASPTATLPDQPTATLPTATPPAPTAPAGGGVIVPTPRPTQPPAPAATSRPAPTLAPTATPPPTAPPPPTATTLPTITPLPGVTPCDGPLVGAFGALWRQRPDVAAAMGCPQEAEVAAAGSALQYYQGGMMLYWAPSQSIYVLIGGSSGTWGAYKAPADPGDLPETAPAGLWAPVRGFGAVWNTNPNVREALGWGTTPEYSVTLVRQRFPSGMMLYAPVLEGTPARIWVLPNSGSWNRYADPTS